MKEKKLSYRSIINAAFVIALLSSLTVTMKLLKEKQANNVFVLSTQNYHENYSRTLEYMEYASQRNFLPVDDIVVHIGSDTLDMSYLSDLVQTKTLILTFSSEMCESCVKYAMEKLKQHFPDYINNDRILFIPINIQERFKNEYFEKELINSIQFPNLLFEGVELHPCFFLLDKDMIIKMLFVPDSQTPELTDIYLSSIKSRFF